MDAFLDRLVPLCLVVLALDTIGAIGAATGLFRLSGLASVLAIAVNVPVVLAGGLWLLRNHRHI